MLRFLGRPTGQANANNHLSSRRVSRDDEHNFPALLMPSELRAYDLSLVNEIILYRKADHVSLRV